MEVTNTVERLGCLLPPQLDSVTREELLSYFENSWELYEVLFSAIQDKDSFYLNPDPLRNPLIFYWGHTAAFYINKLVMAGVLSQGLNAHYENIFARGVDPDQPENLDIRDLWPTVAEVDAYRKEVHGIVTQVIQTIDLNLPITDTHPLWSLMMGIEHDRIHFETSSMLIRQLDVSLLERPEGWKYAPTFGEPKQNEWMDIEGGTVTLGKPKEDALFGWDNEYGALDTSVQSFSVAKNLVTNSDFLKFMDSGAYLNPQFWSEEGWDWRVRTNTVQPKFWVSSDVGVQYRAMFDLLAMPLDWPVEVNAHEAWAYCRWKGPDLRLPTEAEFMLLAKRNPDPMVSKEPNCHFRYGSPTPVGFANCGTDGPTDLWGNVWDWLADDFYGLPGFKTHYLYEDFSAIYMDKEHSMMLGGAWATTGTGASQYYRLWFRRHFYQHAGFRLAKG